MRKFAIAGLMPTAILAAAAVAFAQNPAPVMNATLKVTPTDAGTAKKPKTGNVTIAFDINPESRSTVSRIEYTIPSKVKLNTTGFKTCSADYINANGDDGCSPKAKVGTGSATALLGPTGSQLNFTIDIYSGGPKALTLYLQTSLFNIAIPGKINGQIVAVDIPERVQSPVNGLYAYITGVDARLGKQTGIKGQLTKGSGKKKKTYRFVSVIGCPAAGHLASVKAILTANPSPPPTPSVEDGASSACTK
jgi:hypothetical protein